MYRNAAGADTFEDALNKVQRQLPRGKDAGLCRVRLVRLQPVRQRADGAGLACFRDAKDRYRQVDGKHGPTGIFAIWDQHTEFVQETWLCGEFEHRSSTHTGYRGPFPAPVRP